MDGATMKIWLDCTDWNSHADGNFSQFHQLEARLDPLDTNDWVRGGYHDPAADRNCNNSSCCYRAYDCRVDYDELEDNAEGAAAEAGNVEGADTLVGEDWDWLETRSKDRHDSERSFPSLETLRFLVC